MKTRFINLTVLLLSTFMLKAQQGEIIVIDFEPDSCITSQNAKLWVDFDNDGNGDIFLRMPYTSTGYWPEIVAQNDWEITWLDDNNTDTIPSINHWGQSYLWLDTPDQSRFAARRQFENNHFVYVWFKAYNYVTFNPFVCHLCFDKYAYCTIPDYPLIWGETSLTGVDEESSAFAIVHPNPTTGIVTITGENLRQAEVVNTLGQKILSVQGKRDKLHIDMTALPTGVYFVTVTDKVVKE